MAHAHATRALMGVIVPSKCALMIAMVMVNVMKASALVRKVTSTTIVSHVVRRTAPGTASVKKALAIARLALAKRTAARSTVPPTAAHLLVYAKVQLDVSACQGSRALHAPFACATLVALAMANATMAFASVTMATAVLVARTVTAPTIALDMVPVARAPASATKALEALSPPTAPNSVARTTALARVLVLLVAVNVTRALAAQIALERRVPSHVVSMALVMMALANACLAGLGLFVTRWRANHKIATVVELARTAFAPVIKVSLAKVVRKCFARATAATMDSVRMTEHARVLQVGRVPHVPKILRNAVLTSAAEP